VKLTWDKKANRVVLNVGDRVVNVDLGKGAKTVYAKLPSSKSQKKNPKPKPLPPIRDQDRPMPVPPPGVMAYVIISKNGAVLTDIKSEAEFRALAGKEVKKFAGRQVMRQSPRKVKLSPPKTFPVVDVTIGGDQDTDRDLLEAAQHSRGGVVGIRLHKK